MITLYLNTLLMDVRRKTHCHVPVTITLQRANLPHPQYKAHPALHNTYHNRFHSWTPSTAPAKI